MKKILLILIFTCLNLIAEMKEIKIMDPVLSINGLSYWDENKPDLYRLPKSKKHLFSEAMWRLGTMPSGGIISFRTDSREISLLLDNPQASESTNLTRIAKIGIDLYVNNEFYGNFVPNEKGKMKAIISIDKVGINDIKLYLPLYETIKIDAILVNSKSNVLPSQRNPSESLPIVFYGSSITQGASASNPGLTFPALLSRKLDLEMINLGFSGEGLGQPEIINLIENIKASIFIIDFWANPSPELYEEKLPILIKAIRSKNKYVPIVITSPIYNVGREKENYKKYTISEKIVDGFKMRGDKNIYFHDLYKDFNREYAHYLIDGRHPNTLGMMKITDSLYPTINMILNDNNKFNAKVNEKSTITNLGIK